MCVSSSLLDRNDPARVVRQILGIVNVRYESGLTLQEHDLCTHIDASVGFHGVPAGADLGLVAPIWEGPIVHLAVESALDRRCSHSPRFSEAGNNWRLNFCYRF